MIFNPVSPSQAQLYSRLGVAVSVVTRKEGMGSGGEDGKGIVTNSRLSPHKSHSTHRKGNIEWISKGDKHL